MLAAIGGLLGIPADQASIGNVIGRLVGQPAALALDNLETPWEAETLETEALLAQLAAVPGLSLTGSGVRLVGRLAGISDGRLQFSGSLANQCALSDLKLGRLLDAIDRFATDNGLDGEVDAPHRFPSTRVEPSPPLSLDLARGGIGTIIWATGYRPDYAWLEVPVLDRKGRIRHDGGIVPSPGMYVMGLQFLRRRKSALIDGAGDEARDLSAHLAAWLHGRVTEAAA
jgi:putative flavoprotein involved in K+ transport